MTWFHGSIIDKAIIRIEESIGKIWDKLNES
jgi:hypothetical protein